MILAVALGSILSLLLQILKRWFTFSNEAIKGAVIVVAIIYTIGAQIYANTFVLWDFVFNIGVFIVSNQTFFNMILDNTNTGRAVAGIENTEVKK